MTNKKLVKRDFHNAILAHIESTGFSTADITNQQFVEFLTHELELLNRKNTTEKKPTAQQVANVALADAILDALAADPNRLFSISEMMKEIPACADLSNQRISAVVRSLKESGKVERLEEKRKAYFRFLSH